MYRFQVDYQNKKLYNELSGHMDLNEITAYMHDLHSILEEFGSKEVSVIMVLERLDPVAQESLPICIEGLTIAAEHIKKIAVVHKRVITKMQFSKIWNAVNINCEGSLEVAICKSKNEALLYIGE